MKYVKHFKINGIDTHQVACIELNGRPNAATEGYVGLLGIDITSPTHEVYKCVAVNGSIYTWELLSAGMSVLSADISGEGGASKSFPYSNLRIPNNYLIKVGDLILDSEGYLYQIESIGNTSCTATYCHTHLDGNGGDKDYRLQVVDGALQLVTDSGTVMSSVVYAPSTPIIDVTALPSKNIDTKSLYRLTGTMTYVESTDGKSSYNLSMGTTLQNVLVVDGLPSVGREYSDFNGTLHSAQYNAINNYYYNKADGKVYYYDHIDGWVCINDIEGFVINVVNEGETLTAGDNIVNFVYHPGETALYYYDPSKTWIKLMSDKDIGLLLSQVLNRLNNLTN